MKNKKLTNPNKRKSSVSRGAGLARRIVSSRDSYLGSINTVFMR